MNFVTAISPKELCGVPCKRLTEVCDFLGAFATISFYACEMPSDRQTLPHAPLGFVTFGEVAGVIRANTFYFGQHAQREREFETGQPQFLRIANAAGGVYRDLRIGLNRTREVQFDGWIRKGHPVSGALSLNCPHCSVSFVQDLKKDEALQVLNERLEALGVSIDDGHNFERTKAPDKETSCI